MSNFQIQWNWNMAQQSRAKHNTKTCRCVAEARSFRLCLCRRIKDFHDLNVEWLALPCMCAWMYVCMFTCLCPTHKAILYSCVFIFSKVLTVRLNTCFDTCMYYAASIWNFSIFSTYNYNDRQKRWSHTRST